MKQTLNKKKQYYKSKPNQRPLPTKILKISMQVRQNEKKEN